MWPLVKMTLDTLAEIKFADDTTRIYFSRWCVEHNLVPNINKELIEEWGVAGVCSWGSTSTPKKTSPFPKDCKKKLAIFRHPNELWSLH